MGFLAHTTFLKLSTHNNIIYIETLAENLHFVRNQAFSIQLQIQSTLFKLYNLPPPPSTFCT